MTTSHSIHRSIHGLRSSAKRLLTPTAAKPNSHPFGSDLGRDRDFTRVIQELAATDRASWRR